MNQLYAEAGVKRKDTAATIGLKALMVVGMLIGFFCLFLGQVAGILGAVLIVGIFYFFPKLNVEYEYVFVDGQIDFDKIMGKAKRKNMFRIDFDQVEIMAPVGSHALDGYTYDKLEQKDFSSRNKESKPYAIIASLNEKKYKILFEPSEKMLTMIKQKSPRKVAPY